MRALPAAFLPLLLVLGCNKTIEPTRTEAADAAAPTSPPSGTESMAKASAAPPPRRAAEAKDMWAAEFDYEWEGARGANGITPVVSYQIVVQRADGAYRVSISANGTQTMTRMTGSGTVEGDRLRVLFLECGKEDMFKCNTLKKGDPLLTLDHERGGVWLEFGKMTAPDGKTRELPQVRPKM